MTAPITGPFTKNEYLWDIPDWNGGGSVYKTYDLTRQWYRQAKPYTLPLNFSSVVRRGKSRFTSSGPYGSFFGSWTEAIVAMADPTMDTDLYNQAYARFIDRWKETVELGVATAEGREALSMITHRLGQLANFTRHLSRGKLGLAAGDLGLKWSENLLPRKGRKVKSPQLGRREAIRDFSQLYLEFHFGWSPLVKDIHDGLTVLDSPFKTFHVKSSASKSYPDPRGRVATAEDADFWYAVDTHGTYAQTIRLQAELVMTNPNLGMLQQFGVANPLSVAWELVPFSFVLDWFVNVGDYLGSITDFAGTELKGAQRTVFTRYDGSYIHTTRPKDPKTNNFVTKSWDANNVYCYRYTGLGDGPVLRLRAPKPWGIRRGLAAASLLMQRFPRQVIDKNAASLMRTRSAFRANVFPQFYGKYF